MPTKWNWGEQAIHLEIPWNRRSNVKRHFRPMAFALEVAQAVGHADATHIGEEEVSARAARELVLGVVLMHRQRTQQEARTFQTAAPGKERVYASGVIKGSGPAGQEHSKRARTVIVIRVTRNQHVIIRSTVESVRSAPANQEVLSAFSVQIVAPLAADQNVIALIAGQALTSAPLLFRA